MFNDYVDTKWSKKLQQQYHSIEKNIDRLTNIEAEIAIIGCLLWDNQSYEKISDFLKEEHFADEKNREIFNASIFPENEVTVLVRFGGAACSFGGTT